MLTAELAQPGYHSGQFIRPETQGHYEPRYEGGHGNYHTPSGGFVGHDDGRGSYPNEYTNGYPGGHGGYGGPVLYGQENSSHQAGYGGHNAPDGHGNRSEHRQEYPEGSYSTPERYNSHGEYRGGHNDLAKNAGSHDARGGSYNNHGQGGYAEGHGQYGGAYHSGH